MWIIILLQFCIIRSAWSHFNQDASPLPPDTNCSNKATCFYVTTEKCPPANAKCPCYRLPECPQIAVCCNLTSNYHLTNGLKCSNISNGNYPTESLHIRNATLNSLNLSFPLWKSLKHLSITDGNISNVVGEFGRHASVSCLNLSSNSISQFENRSLIHLNKLQVLDLSNNNISDIPKLKKDSSVRLDISNNKNLSCSSLSEVLTRTKADYFLHANNTFCTTEKTFDWFDSSVELSLQNLLFLRELNKKCLQNCTCKPLRMDIVPGKPVVSSVMVNCSGLQLSSLPSPLPPNTVALNISNNNISSLDLLNSDPTYQGLRQLAADNNQITSILPLEGSKFINNFLALSLRNNKIKTLPTYFLSNMFDRNLVVRQVYLGNNGLHCDCNTARVLKVWLLTKQKNIPDYEEINCDNIKQRVIDLDSSKLCQSQQDWTDYIYYIITAEVLLLVLLIAKVSYDYWVFKTAGYLPWPASKMPKLPCDWLCE